MNANVKYLVDFIVNLDYDKSQLNSLAKVIADTLGKIAPDIDFGGKEGIKEVLSGFMDLQNEAVKLDKALDLIDVEGFEKDMNKALDSIEKSMEQLNEVDINVVDNVLKDMPQEEIDKLGKKFREAFDTFDSKKFNKEIGKLADEFNKAKQETEQLIRTQKSAQAALKLTGKEGTDEYKRLEQQISEAEQQLRKMEKASSQGTAATKTSLGDKLFMFSNFANTVQQLTSTTEQFMQPFEELDKQVRNIGTLGVKNFQDFSDRATDLSQTVPDSAGEIAAGIYDAISAGTIKVKDGIADLDEGMKFVEISSKLAAAGLTTTKDSVNGLTTVMNAYHLEADQAAEVSDIFFGVVNVGKTTIPELNASLSNVIPEAAKLNISFTHLGAALATMTKQGTPTAQATNQLKAAFVELEKPGAELSKILDRANISYKNLSTEGPQETFRKLVAEIEKTGEPMAKFFGSIEASSAVSLLAGKNAQMAADDFAAVSNSVGSTEAAFSIASEGIGTKSKIMMNNIQAGFNKLIDTTGGAEFLSITTKLAPLMTTFTGLAMAMPSAETVRNIKQMGMNIISHIVPALVTQTAVQEGATAAQLKFNLAALANPYVIGIAIFAGAIVGLGLLSDALHDTAKEQLDETKALSENIQKTIEIKNREAAAIESKKKLAQELVKTSKGTADLTKKLNEYDNELKNIRKDLFELEGKKIDVQLQLKKLDVKVESENLRDELAKEFTPSSFEGPFQLLHASAWEALFKFEGEGTLLADKYLKDFNDGLSKAKNSDDVQKTVADLELKILGDDSLDEKLKQKKIASITAIGKKQESLFDQQAVSMAADFSRFQKTGIDKQQVIKAVATKYHTTQQEVEKVIKKEEESKKKTQENVQVVDELAKKWQDVNNELSKSINTQVDKINELKLKKKDGEKIDEKELENEKKKLIVLAERKKTVDKINESTMKVFENPQAVSALDKAQKLLNIEKEKRDLKLQEFEIELINLATSENRKLDETDELAMTRQRLDYQKQELVYAEKTFSKLKEKPEAQKILSDLKKQIADSEANLLKLKPIVDDDALKALQNDLLMKKLEFQLDIGIDPGATSDAMVKLVQEQIKDLREKLSKESDDKAKVDLESKIMDLQKRMSEIINTGSEKIIADIQEKAQKELELTEKKYNQLIEMALKFNDDYKIAKESFWDEQANYELNSLQNTQDERTKILDRQKEAELLSESEYQFKKGELEKKFAAEREAKTKEIADRKQALENALNGFEIEQQRMTDVIKLTKQKDEQDAELKVRKDALEKKKKLLEQDPTNEILKLAIEGEEKSIKKLSEGFDKTNEELAKKSESLNEIMTTIGTSMSEGLAESFAAGNFEGLTKGAKQSMQIIVGILEKQLEALVLSLLTKLGVMGFLESLGPFSLALLPLANMLIRGAVHSIADPILHGLLSFAGGGDITPLGRYDSPTAIRVGDASKYGGPNREWVMNDANIKQTVQLALNNYNNRIENLLLSINNSLSALNIETKLTGPDIKIALKRANFNEIQRSNY